MKRTPFSMTMIGAVSLAVVSGIALAAQDKYTLKVPGGLAFSEFKGYEGWQVVATSQNDKLVAVILANPVMIGAFQVALPAPSLRSCRSSFRRNSNLLSISRPQGSSASPCHQARCSAPTR